VSKQIVRAREERAARARTAAAERRRAEQRAKRRTTTLLVGAVLVAVVLVGIAVQAGRSTSEGPDATPGGTVQTFAFADGAKNAPVTIDVYEDFLCPACQQFLERSGATLEELADSGRARVRYRPISILDRYSTTAYSTRSANAAACVADTSPARTLAFFDLLYRDQPAEGGPGLTDSELAVLAGEAGSGGAAVESCIKDGTFERWTERATDAASKAGVVATPTVLVNGRQLTDPSPEKLVAAVEQASS
jgi:protein-disulfide isomerase